MKTIIRNTAQFFWVWFKNCASHLVVGKRLHCILMVAVMFASDNVDDDLRSVYLLIG